MSAPIILDLFSCAGGAARGYQKAGFRTWGVDKVARPRYCGERFTKMDASEFIRVYHLEISHTCVAVHWSPPCQRNCTLTQGTNKKRREREHEDLIPIMRPLIEKLGLPWILEQPTGRAPMRKDLMLCGSQFRDKIGPPPYVQRHRYFEIEGFSVPKLAHDSKHEGLRTSGWNHGEFTPFGPRAPYVQVYGKGGRKATIEQAQHALGIDWTDDQVELNEAIPPYMTEYIGTHLMKALT